MLTLIIVKPYLKSTYPLLDNKKMCFYYPVRFFSNKQILLKRLKRRFNNKYHKRFLDGDFKNEFMQNVMSPGLEKVIEKQSVFALLKKEDRENLLFFKGLCESTKTNAQVQSILDENVPRVHSDGPSLEDRIEKGFFMLCSGEDPQKKTVSKGIFLKDRFVNYLWSIYQDALPELNYVPKRMVNLELGTPVPLTQSRFKTIFSKRSNIPPMAEYVAKSLRKGYWGDPNFYDDIVKAQLIGRGDYHVPYSSLISKLSEGLYEVISYCHFFFYLRDKSIRRLSDPWISQLVNTAGSRYRGRRVFRTKLQNRAATILFSALSEYGVVGKRQSVVVKKKRDFQTYTFSRIFGPGSVIGSRFKFPKIVPINSTAVSVHVKSGGVVSIEDPKNVLLDFLKQWNSVKFQACPVALTVFKKHIFSLDPSDPNIKLCSIGDYFLAVQDLKKLEDSFPKKLKFVVDFSFYKKIRVVKGSLFLETLHAWGIDISVYQRLLKKVLSLEMSLYASVLNVALCESLARRPLYFTCFMDYRLRYYSNPEMLGSNSGEARLLKTYSHGLGIRPNQEDFLFLANLYYDGSTVWTNRSYKDSTRKNLPLFLENNPSPKKSLFTQILKIRLQNAIKNRRIGFSVNLDQKSSALMILGLITKEPILLEKCMLKTNAKSANQTPVEYLFDNTHDYFVKQKYEFPSVSALFHPQFKFHKKAVIAFLGGQTSGRRYFEWCSMLESIDSKNLPKNVPMSDIKQILLKFSLEYSTFLSECFPNMESHLNTIKRIFELVFKKKKCLFLKMPDSIVVKYFKIKATKVKHLWRRKTHSQNITLYHDTMIPKFKDVQRLPLSFLIQNFDSYIARQTVLALKGIPVEWNHDCVSFHPKQLPLVEEALLGIYKNLAKMNLIEYCLIRPNTNCFSKKELLEIRSLFSKKRFKLTTTNLLDLYSFEHK